MIKFTSGHDAKQNANRGTSKRAPMSDELIDGLEKPRLTRQSSKSRPTGGTLFSRHQTMINFWLDAALLLNFMALVWVSVIVRFIFPPAENAVGFLLWGLSLSQFMDVQFGVLAVFCLGIVVHLMLHWTWVCGVVGSKILRSRDGSKRTMDDGQRTIFGVGLMIVLLNIMGIGVAIAALAMRSPI